MTRQQAINEKCKECIYDPEVEGTWRMQAEACELIDCALWEYRPKSRSKRPNLVDSASVQPHYEGNQGQVIAEGLQERDQYECMRLGDL
jgi:hypothetical protein